MTLFFKVRVNLYSLGSHCKKKQKPKNHNSPVMCLPEVQWPCFPSWGLSLEEQSPVNVELRWKEVSKKKKKPSNLCYSLLPTPPCKTSKQSSAQSQHLFFEIYCFYKLWESLVQCLHICSSKWSLMKMTVTIVTALRTLHVFPSHSFMAEAAIPV